MKRSHDDVYGGHGGSGYRGGRYGGGDRRGGYDSRRGGYDDRRSGGGGGRYGGSGGHYGGGGGGGGGYRGGGGRGGRGGWGGRPRVPDMSGLTSCLTNIVLADVTEGFQFYLYSVHVEDAHGRAIDSRHRRKFLFNIGLLDGFLKDMPQKAKEDLKRVLFFNGSFFFSGRPVPGLDPEKLPLELPVSEKAEGDKIKIMQMVHYTAPKEMKIGGPALKKHEVAFDLRCSDCTKAFADVGALLQHCQQAEHKPVYTPELAGAGAQSSPATLDLFIAYANAALERALSERLARWGSEFIDPAQFTEPEDRRGNNLGVRVYQAFCCNFGFKKPSIQSPAHLGLTVDLRAKVVRTMSVLDHLRGPGGEDYNPSYNEQERAKREWIGEIVICMHDKKCYSVVDLLFDHSAMSLPIQGLNMSHAEYFQKRKGIDLRYPDAKPMIAVLGRRNQTIFLPPELVAGNEMERRVKEQLASIASYNPQARNEAIEKIRAYLVPGAQKTKGAGGLLPALGIVLHQKRLSAKAKVLPLPRMLAAGIEVPKHRGQNWAPLLNRASFDVHPKQANTLNVTLVYNEKLERGAKRVYEKIRDLVNNFNSAYRFSDEPTRIVRAGDNERHWGVVERCFSGSQENHENVFVLDFNKPRGTSDPAYPVVKQMLTKNGYISQFVNFNTYPHDNPRDEKRSLIILQGVARQIIQKTGTRLWWVNIPESLPTPAVFIGIDVFHAPRKYDPVAEKRVRKASCAAIIVEVHRSSKDKAAKIELYTETVAREGGKEFGLGEALTATVSRALRELKVNPMSCIVWRDGIGESEFTNSAIEEIDAIRVGLKGGNPVGTSDPDLDVPLSYIVCQKRIDTKFLSKGIPNERDGKYGAPPGTLVDGIQGLDHETFYINGRAPPYSTPKAVRYIVVRKDDELKQVPLTTLTWDLCHDYPNWTGPIKVPSVCQMAHKLAELGGNFPDCGANINASKLKNTIHFL